MNRAANDLISRTVLIDELMAGCMPLDLPGLSGVTGDELTIRDYIDSAPSVDAAPVVHGRWIDIPDKREWDQKMCSICGDYRCCQSNYCPNCGAKMESEHNMNKSNETTIGHWLDGSDDLPPIGGFHD